jgi:hypothetical protein
MDGKFIKRNRSACRQAELTSIRFSADVKIIARQVRESQEELLNRNEVVPRSLRITGGVIIRIIREREADSRRCLYVECVGESVPREREVLESAACRRSAERTVLGEEAEKTRTTRTAVRPPDQRIGSGRVLRLGVPYTTEMQEGEEERTVRTGIGCDYSRMQIQRCSCHIVWTGSRRFACYSLD